MNRTMNRIIPTALVAIFITNVVFADETTYRRECHHDFYGNSYCIMTISSPPTIQDPPYRGPGTEETILIQPKTPVSEITAPKTLPDNGCGAGFRMLPSGTCELKR